MSVWTVLIAIVMAVVIWKSTMFFIRMMATPPDEVDPMDTRDTLEHYRCQVCGSEMTLTVANTAETGPPRHCREDMVMVWRPGGLENPD